MDAGKANAYHHAAKWLEKARSAYLAADREADVRLIGALGVRWVLTGNVSLFGRTDGHVVPPTSGKGEIVVIPAPIH